MGVLFWELPQKGPHLNLPLVTPPIHAKQPKSLKNKRKRSFRLFSVLLMCRIYYITKIHILDIIDSPQLHKGYLMTYKKPNSYFCFNLKTIIRSNRINHNAFMYGVEIICKIQYS